MCAMVAAIKLIEEAVMALAEQQSSPKRINSLNYIMTGVLVALASAAILVLLSSAFNDRVLGLKWLADRQIWVDSFFQNLARRSLVP